MARKFSMILLGLLSVAACAVPSPEIASGPWHAWLDSLGIEFPLLLAEPTADRPT